MSGYFPPGHPYHKPEQSNNWWLNTSRGGNSSDSSLGTTSSCGTLFSDSANSQDHNWRNGKVWTSLSVGSDNEARGVRRGWSTSSSESGSSTRGGWINPCPSTEVSSSSSREDSRGASSRASPGDQQPVTRQSVQTERVQRAASEIRAWGISVHNSFRAQEPNQPQPQELDRLTSRHWTRLGLQERQPGSAPVLRTPRFEPPRFDPAPRQAPPPAPTPGRQTGVFGGPAFVPLGAPGGSASPAPRDLGAVPRRRRDY